MQARRDYSGVGRLSSHLGHDTPAVWEFHTYGAHGYVESYVRTTSYISTSGRGAGTQVISHGVVPHSCPLGSITHCRVFSRRTFVSSTDAGKGVLLIHCASVNHGIFSIHRKMLHTDSGSACDLASSFLSLVTYRSGIVHNTEARPPWQRRSSTLHDNSIGRSECIGARQGHV